MAMEQRIYFIYKYTFPNGKVYIGQTYKGSGRFGKTMKYRGTLVGNAMSKYPNYKKEILEYCTKENVDEREKHYIQLFDSTNRNKGYNREYGGNLHKEITSDLRKELSDVHIDLQVTEIEQYTLDNVFLRNWKSIKEASNELGIERTSISKALHGSIKSAGGYIWKLKSVYSPYNSRPISQYDLKGNFIRDWDNVQQAEQLLKIHNILNALNGRNKTAGGFQWKYKGSGKVITEYKQNREYKGRHVFQYDLNGNFIKEWKSYLQAAKELGIPHQHILRVLKGERKMTRGYIFKYEYVEKNSKYNPDDKSFIKPVEQYSIDGIFVREWPSITAAEKELGISSGIGKCCSGKNKTAGSFQWKYKGDSRQIKSLIKPKPIKIKKPRPLPSNAKTISQFTLDDVLLDTFESIAKASRLTGVSIANISGCLKGRQKTAGGFKWKYK
jgi:plasmid maintenance system antidote protein VapI